MPVVGWAAIIYALSAKESLGTGGGIWDFGLRKTAHVVEFGVLSLLVWRAIRQHDVRGSRALPVSFAFSLLYAFSDEIHQHFVRGRNGTIRDVGFDLAGIVIALTFANITGKKRCESVVSCKQK